jgi:hypothetical protein
VEWLESTRENAKNSSATIIVRTTMLFYYLEGLNLAWLIYIHTHGKHLRGLGHMPANMDARSQT